MDPRHTAARARYGATDSRRAHATPDGRLYAALFAVAVCALGVPAATYHVAPDGRDEADGALATPFATVRKGLSRLNPGDTLYLRAGVYREAGLRISLAGSESARTLVASYPGERAEIRGAHPDFETAPNDEWELVDGARGIYRSRKTFTQQWGAAWLVREAIMLPHYETYESFTADRCDCNAGYCYAGPGVFLRNGRLEIRLTHDPNDLRGPDGRAVAPVPADPNPNHNAILFDRNTLTFYVSNSSYLTIRNIDFHQGDWRTVEVSEGSHHIEFDGCTIRARSYGLLVRAQTHSIEIHHCLFDNGLADWFRWGDVKNGCTPLEGYNNFMVGLGGENHHVHDNTWRNCFINLSFGERNTRVVNNLFIRPHETFHISPNAENLEIAGNVIRHGMEAFAKVPRNSTLDGDVYIHHNIVDLTAVRRVERDGNLGEFNRVWTPGWAIWGSHGCDDRCDNSRWIIYNNTFVCRIGSLRSWGSKHREYNNIFYEAGSRSVNSFNGVDAAGNVVWRTGGGAGVSEPQGLALDPRFDTTALMTERYDQAGIDAVRALYLPGEDRMFTTGKTYAGLAWPGAAGVDYRGALGRQTATARASFVATARGRGADIRMRWYAINGATADAAVRGGVRVLVSDAGTRMVTAPDGLDRRRHP